MKAKSEAARKLIDSLWENGGGFYGVNNETPLTVALDGSFNAFQLRHYAEVLEQLGELERTSVVKELEAKDYEC